MAPTELKCGNKKVWVAEVAYWPKMRVGPYVPKNDGDGRPAPHSQSTDEINAGKERRMVQLARVYVLIGVVSSRFDFACP